MNAARIRSGVRGVIAQNESMNKIKLTYNNYL